VQPHGNRSEVLAQVSRRVVKSTLPICGPRAFAWLRGLFSLPYLPPRQRTKVFAFFLVTDQVGKKEIRKEKAFFFEKKKQKTFIYCRRHGIRTGEFTAIRNR
jgi:hypothetical protein